MPISRPPAASAPGTVAWFARGDTIPNGWLFANGAAVSRTTYAMLFAWIGTIYGAGDGSTTFNLPDLRGEFIRGLDLGRGVDSGRTIGTAQAGDIQSHTHTVRTYQGSSGSAVGNNGTNTVGPIDIASVATGGTETRPRNVAMVAMIKW